MHHVYCVQVVVKHVLAHCYASVLCARTYTLTHLWTYALTPENSGNSMQASIMCSMECDIVTPGLASTICRIAVRQTVQSFLWLQKEGRDVLRRNKVWMP